MWKWNLNNGIFSDLKSLAKRYVAGHNDARIFKYASLFSSHYIMADTSRIHSFKRDVRRFPFYGIW